LHGHLTLVYNVDKKVSTNFEKVFMHILAKAYMSNI